MVHCKLADSSTGSPPSPGAFDDETAYPENASKEMLMNRTKLVPTFLRLAAVSLCPLAYDEADSERQPIAFVNVNVVSMSSDRIIANQTVLIQDGRIHAIGPSDSVSIPGGFSAY